MRARPAGLRVATWRRRASRLVLLILSSSVLAGACGSSPAPSASPSADAPTVWQAITDQVTDGDIPRDAALQAFAYVYGVDLPGVRIPDGRRPAGDAPQSGTGVLTWVWQHWPELTPEQRQIVGRYSGAQPGDRVLRGLTAIAGGGHGAAVHAPVNGPTTATELAYRIDVLEDLYRIGRKLGLPTLDLHTLVFSERSPKDVVATSWACEVEDVAGDTAPCVNRGEFGTCNISIWKPTWSANPTVTPLIHEVLTHEVVHCYQNTIWSDMATEFRIPKWIREGSALWLATDDTRFEEVMVKLQWDRWFDEPGRDLVNRTYDGYAWLSLLHQLKRDLWTGMVPAWRQANAFSNTASSAFIAALQGDNDDVRREWAPSLLNNGTWGAPWVTDGLGVPSGSTAMQSDQLFVDKTGFDKAAYGRTAWIHTVAGVSDEIVLVSTDGIAAAHEATAGGETFPGFSSKRFCVKGDCICPAGTKHAGERMADATIALPFVAAFHGGPQNWGYHIASLELAELCKVEPTPAPSLATPAPSGSTAAASRPCAVGCAGSNGDPHLRTVNRAAYDFQAAGEYVLLASADRSLEIQARQEPLGGKAAVSINTAIALRASGHRVAAYLADADAEITLTLDGAPLTVVAPVALGGGLRIAKFSRGIEIDLPDGTQVFLLSVRRYGINILVQASETLRVSGVGLLAAVPPGGLRVPAMPDGSRVPQAADRHERHHLLYEVFGPAWLVTSATSLFDYDAGKNPSTYVIPGFPAEAAVRTFDDLTATERDAGQRACAGVTDPDLLIECMFDVSITGLQAFADLYARTNRFVTIGTQALDEPSPTVAPSLGALPAGFVSLVPTVYAVWGKALGTDGTVYVSIGRSATEFELLAIDPATATIRGRVDIPGSGRIAVAAGSVWVGQQVDFGPCAIRRLDPASLATQATIDAPCTIFGATFAALGEEIWFADPTTTNADGKGGRLRLIDPATNTVGRSVELPYINGSLSASADALFWTDTGKETFRLRSGETAFATLGQRATRQFPIGDGVWTQNQTPTNQAEFVTSAGPADVVVPIEGNLVGADTGGVYVEILDYGPVLWRFPTSGGIPTEIARGTIIDTARGPGIMGYFGSTALLIGHGNAVTLWLIPSASTAQRLQLVMQVAPLP